MDFLAGVFNILSNIWSWLAGAFTALFGVLGNIYTELKCFLPNLWLRFLDVMVTLQEETSVALLAVLNVIPLPDAVQNFQWPDVGPLGYAIVQSGMPQALTILSGALFIRFIKGLILHTKS